MENKISRHPEATSSCHCERNDAISYRLPRAYALAKTETSRSASFCHSCQAQRERESMPRQARHDTFGQMGRSMVEMLGVLAIMGIVGMVGVKMYNVAMNKHHANTLIEQAQRRAVSAASQINLMGHAPSLADFTENTFGGGTFGGVTQEGLSKQFGIQVSGVSKAVCENILSSIGENTSLRRLNLISAPSMSLSACADNDAFLMIYNNDLKGSSGDPSHTCNTDADCATLCGTCGEDHQCVGECPAETKTCAVDSECQQEGIICAGCNHRLGMCQSCQPVDYLEGTGTQYIDTEYASGGVGIKAETVVMKRGSAVEQSPIGRTTGNGFDLYIYQNSVGLWNKSGAVLRYSASARVNTKVYLLGHISSNVISLTVNKTTQTINVTTIDGNTTADGHMGKMILFNHINQYPFSGRMYYCKIWDNGNLVRDFVPVHAPFQPTGKQNCMFDKVSQTLFCNAATGDDFKTNLQ